MKNETNSPRIVTFHPDYIKAFVKLNREWIQKYFVLEAMDLAQLQSPDKHIIQPGGEIFFLLVDGQAVGTCAMVPHGELSYELAKMAVDPAFRGKGYGDHLIEAAKEWARKKKAQRITLLSNTILEPAIALYKKHGFQTVHLGKHPDYDRCNIEMSFDL